MLFIGLGGSEVEGSEDQLGVVFHVLDSGDQRSQRVFMQIVSKSDESMPSKL